MSKTSEPPKEASEAVYMEGGKPMIKTPDGEARRLSWKPAASPPVTDIKFFDTGMEGGYEYRSRGVVGFNAKEQWACLVYHTSSEEPLQWIVKEYYDGFLGESAEGEGERIDLSCCDYCEVDFWIDAPGEKL